MTKQCADLPRILVACDGTSYLSEDERNASREPNPGRTAQDAVAFARSAVAALADQPFRVTIVLGEFYDAAHLIPAANVQVVREASFDKALAGVMVVLCPAGSEAVAGAARAGVRLALVPFGTKQGDRRQQQLADQLCEAGLAAQCPAHRLRARRLQQTLTNAMRLRSKGRCAR